MTAATGTSRSGTAQTPPADGHGPGNARSPAAATRGTRPWRAPAVLAGIILASGVVIALLQAGQAVTGTLDPRSTGPDGTHALAALLRGQGRTVTTVETVATALAQAGRAGTTVVVTSPQLLGPASLAALARTRASLLIVAPTKGALARLAPAVTLAGPAPAGSDPPRCGLPAARLAGSADMGGMLVRSAAPGTWRCYPPRRAPAGGTPSAPASDTPASGSPPGSLPTASTGSVSASLVRYTSGGRTITVLGTGTPLANRNLGRDGNAALALNLLETASHVVWLVPGPQEVAAAGQAHGQRPLRSLVPGPAYLVAFEVGVAVLLAIAWRLRRFGPLVAEPMPVVVRASETVEGHGRLYRSRRSRDRAAGVLRTATLSRITSRTGLPPQAPAAAVCRDVALRTGRDAAQVDAILFGPVPRDDAALLRLATDLDSLEGQVLTQ